jgi:hypothetical protein
MSAASSTTSDWPIFKGGEVEELPDGLLVGFRGTVVALAAPTDDEGFIDEGCMDCRAILISGLEPVRLAAATNTGLFGGSKVAGVGSTGRGALIGGSPVGFTAGALTVGDSRGRGGVRGLEMERRRPGCLATLDTEGAGSLLWSVGIVSEIASLGKRG